MGNFKSTTTSSPISSPIASPSSSSSSRSLFSSLLIKEISIEELSNIKYEDVWISFRKYEDNIGIHVYYLNFDQFNEIFVNLFGNKCHHYFNIFKNSNTTMTTDNVVNQYEEYEEYGNYYIYI